jgi:hypothetical protein
VELVATSEVSVQQAGGITVPGRKLLDIFRSPRYVSRINRFKRAA